MARPRIDRSAPHDHEWTANGAEEIGGVRFRIDVCSVTGCGKRRACRLTGIGAQPAPERSVAFEQFESFVRSLMAVPKAEIDAAMAGRPRKTRVKRPRCAGEGKEPERVTRAELVYKLAVSGKDHHVGGRGICPVCGGEQGVTKGRVRWHFEPHLTNSQVSAVARDAEIVDD